MSHVFPLMDRIKYLNSMRIQDKMTRRSIKSGHAHGVKHGKYALTELLRCADCESSFRRVSWRLGEKKFLYTDVRIEY